MACTAMYRALCKAVDKLLYPAGADVLYLLFSDV
jgi:hypothetical protein